MSTQTFTIGRNGRYTLTLTDGQVELLKLLHKGLTEAEAAEKLGIDTLSVGKACRRICKAMGAKRHEMLMFADAFQVFGPPWKPLTKEQRYEKFMRYHGAYEIIHVLNARIAALTEAGQ